ncbi:Trm112 family protein [Candidatus Altiarchaeota archaeon]
MALDERLLAILACPKCKSDLSYRHDEGRESLTCKKCRLRYPVKDDIPVMLINEAEQI